MFTGIVTAVGRVVDVRQDGGGIELAIEAPYDDLELGESVAVDGACLTVQELGAGQFGVHVIATSLDRTRISRYQPGRRVNLERALRVGDRLGGHLVQGHVDGVGVVERVADRADARLRVENVGELGEIAQQVRLLLRGARREQRAGGVDVTALQRRELLAPVGRVRRCGANEIDQRVGDALHRRDDNDLRRVLALEQHAADVRDALRIRHARAAEFVCDPGG